MRILDLLSKLDKLGCRLSIEGENLKLQTNQVDVDPLLIAFLKENKTDIIDYLKRNSNHNIKYETSVIEKKEYYPLSSIQKRFYILQNMNPLGTSYNMPYIIPLDQHLNIEIIEKAFNNIVLRNENFRTSFKEVNDEVVQVISETSALNITYFDIPSESNKEEIKKIVKDFIKPFNLLEGPLFRIGLIKRPNQDYILMVDMHHIISDGVSTSIIGKELLGSFEGKANFPKRIQYRDFANWQNINLENGNFKKEEEYWLNVFKDEISTLDLPIDFSRPMIQSFEGATLHFQLEEEKLTEINRIIRESGTTINIFLLTVFKTLLYRYTNQSEIIVGSPIAGRPFTEFYDVMGAFVNTIVLKSNIEGNTTFRSLLNTIKSTVFSAFENQNYPFDELIKKIKTNRDPKRNPLFDVLFVMDSKESDANQTEKSRDSIYNYEQVTSKFDLSLIILKSQVEIDFQVEYCVKLFKQDTIERFISHFKNILEIVLQDPSLRLKDIDFLSHKEKRKLINEFNSTKIEYFNNKSICQIFEDQIVINSSRVALIFGSIAGTNSMLSYGELYKRSLQMSQYLKLNGILPGSIVGITTNRSIEMMVGIYGILMAGGAYMPVDPSYPEEKLNYVLKDSNCKIILQGKPNEFNANQKYKLIDLADENLYNINYSNFKNQSDLENIAYVIYTSGSTGKPKGVIINHNALINRLKWMQKEYPITINDVIIQKTPLVFDVSVWELFWWSLQGAKLSLLNPEKEKEPNYIVKSIERTQVTVMHFVPSMLNAFLEYLNDGFTYKKLKSLKYVFSSGEALKLTHILKFNEFIRSHLKISLINLYGPTEATVDVSYFNIIENFNSEIVPIGKPIDNISLYVLDSNMNIQPVGVSGELCISGVGLSNGYLNKVELTNEKFVVNPFSMQERLYKTGDFGKWREDGNIEYLGRIDNQVKINGNRIELGEIENKLLEHPLVKDAIVLMNKSDKDIHYLCAYYTSYEKNEIKDLKSFLSKKLSNSMIPNFIIKIDSIPVTSNGKIDKRRLLSLYVEPEDEIINPRTLEEEEIAVIWNTYLPTSANNIRANFFSVGGDSIIAIRLIAALNKKYKYNYVISDLYSNQTIEELALLINTSKSNDNSKFYNDAYQEIENFRKTYGYLITEKVQDIYPMNNIEKGMIYYSLLSNNYEPNDSNKNLYHEVNIYKVNHKKFDIDRFRKALHLLVVKHSCMRKSFIIEKEIQIVYKEVYEDVVFHDISDKSFIVQKEIINGAVQKASLLTFNLSITPIWRMNIYKINTDLHYLLFESHHTLMDGWSLASFLTELNYTYIQLKTNTRYIPVSLKCDFKDQIIYEIAEKNKKENIEFWKSELLEYKRLIFPLISDRKECKQINADLGIQNYKDLTDLSKNSNISIKHICFAAYLYTMSFYSRESDITVGIVTNNRPPIEDGDKLVGCFVSTIPFRYTIPLNISWLEYLKIIDKKMILLQKYDKFSLTDILKVIEEPIAAINPIFDTKFNFIDFHIFNDLIAEDIKNDNEDLFDGGNFLNQNTLCDFHAGINQNKMFILFKYSTSILTEEMAQGIISIYTSILHEIINKTDHIIDKTNILTTKEVTELLYDFNNTKDDYVNQKNIHQWFEEQVKQIPDKIALVYGDLRITFDELNHKSNRVANYLRNRGITINSVVGLIFETSLEMIISLFGVLKSGGCFLPINPEQPDNRISFILRDSGSEIVLTNVLAVSKVRFDTDADVCYINDCFKTESFCNLENRNIISDSIYLIYTSGTTGRPKGVVVKHENLLNYVSWFSNISRLTQTDKAALTTSYSFDLGYTSVFSSLLNGCELHLFHKELYLSPTEFNRYIIENEITYLKTTSSLYSLFVDATGFYEAVNILRLVILGGESINSKVVETSLLLNEEIQIINHYGPTEATIGCVACLIDKKNVKSFLNRPIIGKPILNTATYILDENSKILSKGAIGELCISGLGLAKGYLNNPELSSIKFIDHPFKNGEKLYRTGDIARWLTDGNIEFMGRMDNQLKIRGYRIELNEIKSIIDTHSEIKESIVIAMGSKGEKHLCAYVVFKSNKSENIQLLKSYLSEHLPDYMRPSFIIKIDSIPLTSNGKTDYKSLPDPEIKGEFYVAPTTSLERKLVNIWSEVLNLKSNEISISESFFELGGHSLKVIALVSQIQKELGVLLGLKSIFQNQTIRGQVELISKSDNLSFISVPNVEKIEYYQLSSAQTRLYLLQQMDLESVAYNMPYVISLGTVAYKVKIEAVFRRLVARHDSFRTSFEIIGEEPVQRIHKEINFKIKEYSIEKSEEQNLRNQFIQPFDLSKAPLLRIAIVEIKGEGNLLLLDMHHIISDGVSHSILEEEYRKLLKGEELPALRLQYKDYGEWQNSSKEQEKKKGQEAYWLKQFEGEVPVLNLPTDYTRPLMQSFEGASVRFTLSIEETSKVKLLAKENGLTLYMSLLSVFTILLSKLSGQEDIIIGTPIAARRHRDFESIVGMFINTLAMRNYISIDMPIKDYLKNFKENTLEAYENQDYQFADLVKKISFKRDFSRNPLFDVMFNLLNHEEYSGDLSEFDRHGLIHTPGISKFDLTLTAVDYGTQILLNLDYCTKLFSAETIERYIGYFKRIVEQMTIGLEKQISEIDILSSEEKHQLLYGFNDTRADYPKDKTIHQLFEEQVIRTPDNIAIVFEEVHISYLELNKKSNQMARYLTQKGIFKQDFVGIMYESSLEVYINILGVLKTGNAYLPIDSSLPESRICFMIKDCGVKILLSLNHKRINFTGKDYSISSISTFENNICDSSNLNINISSSSPAYIIYTSGSTGMPKGVVIGNGALVNLCFWHNLFYGINQKDHISKYAGFGFDASVWEIFPCLTIGASLHIIGENIKLDAEEVNKYFHKKNITISFLPTQFCENFMEFDNKSLRILLTGGDKLKYYKKRNYILYNNYGPTENTVVTTRFEVNNFDNNIPIGCPIGNVCVYILDRNNLLQPIGVSGELCISGDGLAIGYLNNPELTLDKFIDNPFKKGEKLYRTGDLARWLPDGNIQFMGRIDNQVKIRGFRIELGEIESALQQHGHVKESVVLVVERNGESYLCAYVVLDTEVAIEDLRAHLSNLLPDYMIPTYFEIIDKIPLTFNGKTDRKSLPEPKIKEKDLIAPRNEIEEKLVEIWSEVLKIERWKISIDANFLEIGGHSLLMIKVVRKIINNTGYELTIMDLFRHTTIRDLTNYIINNKNYDVTKNDRIEKVIQGKSSMKKLLKINKT